MSKVLKSQRSFSVSFSREKLFGKREMCFTVVLQSTLRHRLEFVFTANLDYLNCFV